MGDRAVRKANIDNIFKFCFIAELRNDSGAIERFGIQREIFNKNNTAYVCSNCNNPKKRRIDNAVEKGENYKSY